jgi:hypothetical protein
LKFKLKNFVPETFIHKKMNSRPYQQKKSFLVSTCCKSLIDNFDQDVGRPQVPKPVTGTPNGNPTVTLAPTPSDPTKFQLMPEDAGKIRVLHDN